MAAFDLFTERMMLTGPSDADLPRLQALGYDPAAIVQPRRTAPTTRPPSAGSSPTMYAAIPLACSTGCWRANSTPRTW